eukprot:GEMP01040588.1.p1 GENE.GEMP01040588.1~~GEMP01040588.1.p1  ORF type:complete len:373 (+),score=60.43 GEMP01040588.1:139-1257(+)
MNAPASCLSMMDPQQEIALRLRALNHNIANHRYACSEDYVWLLESIEYQKNYINELMAELPATAYFLPKFRREMEEIDRQGIRMSIPFNPVSIEDEAGNVEFKVLFEGKSETELRQDAEDMAEIHQQVCILKALAETTASFIEEADEPLTRSEILLSSACSQTAKASEILMESASPAHWAYGASLGGALSFASCLLLSPVSIPLSAAFIIGTIGTVTGGISGARYYRRKRREMWVAGDLPTPQDACAEIQKAWARMDAVKLELLVHRMKGRDVCDARESLENALVTKFELAPKYIDDDTTSIFLIVKAWVCLEARCIMCFQRTKNSLRQVISGPGVLMCSEHTAKEIRYHVAAPDPYQSKVETKFCDVLRSL